MSVENSTHFIPRLSTPLTIEVAAAITPVVLIAARKLAHEPQKLSEVRHKLTKGIHGLTQEPQIESFTPRSEIIFEPKNIIEGQLVYEA